MLYRYSIKHPWLVLLLAGVVTALVAPGVLRLKIRTDGHALVPVGADEIRVDREIRDRFATEDPIVVLICADDENGIYNQHTIALVAELTESLQGMDGVEAADVMSLATEKGDRVRPGTLVFRRFLEPMPQTRQALDQLRGDIRAIELYNGILVSYDETATAILIEVPHGCVRTEFYGRVRAIVDARDDIVEQVHIIGAPVAESLLGTHILEDLGVPAAVLGQRTWRAEDVGRGDWPTSLYEWRVWIGQHVGLVPIALGLMALVFLVSFRSIPAVALPLGEVGACLVFVFGVMGYANVPVYLTIAVLPVILTAIGVADEIHIFARFRELMREGTGAAVADVVSATMKEMTTPVVKTSITTAVGFLSFALSPIAPVRAFGVFTALGIMFCMVWSLLVVPAMLVIVTRQRKGDSQSNVLVSRSSWLALLGTIVVRRRFAILALGLAVACVSPFGVRQIVVQDSWIDGFAPESEFHKSTLLFNREFLGTHILLMEVDASQGEPLTGTVKPGALGHHGLQVAADLVEDPSSLDGRRIILRRADSPPGGFKDIRQRRMRYVWETQIEKGTREGDYIHIATKLQSGSPILALRTGDGIEVNFEILVQPFMEPENIRRVGALEDFITAQTQDAVGGVLGTASLVRTTEFMIRARKEGSRAVPDHRDRMRWVWGRYKAVRGARRFQQAVDATYDRALVTAYLKNANFVATARLMNSIREYEGEHLIPHGMRIEFGGDVAVSQALIQAIVKTQVQSLIVSLAGIFLVTALMGRSILWGLLCVLPCGLAVLVNFAVMGWWGMPLGVATSMFAGMTLGIGVDYAIHLLERYKLSRSRGLDLDAALSDAISATGPAILIDALAVAIGFGVMMLSQVPANARLGGLVVLSIFTCFAATMFLLPALVRAFRVGGGAKEADSAS